MTAADETYEIVDDSPIFIMPISGKYFPLQLTALYLLQLAAGDKPPKASLCSSGGAAVSAVGYGASWKAERIRTLAGTVSGRDFFIKPTFMIPELAAWFIMGYTVIPSPNIFDLGKKFYGNSIGVEGKTELICGAYCKNTFKLELFSTATETHSMFTSAHIDHHLGDGQRVPEMILATLASAAVPLVVPPIRVFMDSKKIYSDGGIYSPSPWSVLNHNIMAAYAPAIRPFKLVYFASSVEPVITSYATLDPIFRMIGAVSNVEIANLIEHFKATVGSTLDVVYSSISDAYVQFNASRVALMVIKPIHGENYNFKTFDFSGTLLQRIMDTFRTFVVEVYSVMLPSI